MPNGFRIGSGFDIEGVAGGKHFDSFCYGAKGLGGGSGIPIAARRCHVIDGGVCGFARHDDGGKGRTRE